MNSMNKALSVCVLVGTWLGPGVSASTLDTTSGLNVWLRADSLATTGVTVDQWTDLTGTGLGIGDNVSQDAALTDGGPSLVNDAVNGRPSVN